MGIMPLNDDQIIIGLTIQLTAQRNLEVHHGDDATSLQLMNLAEEYFDEVLYFFLKKL